MHRIETKTAPKPSQPELILSDGKSPVLTFNKRVRYPAPPPLNRKYKQNNNTHKNNKQMSSTFGMEDIYYILSPNWPFD